MFSVLFLGSEIRGTSGWFNLGFFNLQPVELVKIFSIIFLASYFGRVGNMKIGIKEFFRSFLIMALPILLTLKQPDLGSASVLIIIWVGVSLMAGVNKKYLVILFLIGLLGSFIGYRFVFEDYQKERIQTFWTQKEIPWGADIT